MGVNLTDVEVVAAERARELGPPPRGAHARQGHPRDDRHRHRPCSGRAARGAERQDRIEGAARAPPALRPAEGDLQHGADRFAQSDVREDGARDQGGRRSEPLTDRLQAGVHPLALDGVPLGAPLGAGHARPPVAAPRQPQPDIPRQVRAQRRGAAAERVSTRKTEEPIDEPGLRRRRDRARRA